MVKTGINLTSCIVRKAIRVSSYVSLRNRNDLLWDPVTWMSTVGCNGAVRVAVGLGSFKYCEINEINCLTLLQYKLSIMMKDLECFRQIFAQLFAQILLVIVRAYISKSCQYFFSYSIRNGECSTKVHAEYLRCVQRKFRQGWWQIVAFHRVLNVSNHIR